MPLNLVIILPNNQEVLLAEDVRGMQDYENQPNGDGHCTMWAIELIDRILSRLPSRSDVTAVGPDLGSGSHVVVPPSHSITSAAAPTRSAEPPLSPRISPEELSRITKARLPTSSQTLMSRRDIPQEDSVLTALRAAYHSHQPDVVDIRGQDYDVEDSSKIFRSICGSQFPRIQLLWSSPSKEIPPISKVKVNPSTDTRPWLNRKLLLARHTGKLLSNLLYIHLELHKNMHELFEKLNSNGQWVMVIGMTKHEINDSAPQMRATGGHSYVLCPPTLRIRHRNRGETNWTSGVLGCWLFCDPSVARNHLILNLDPPWVNMEQSVPPRTFPESIIELLSTSPNSGFSIGINMTASLDYGIQKALWWERFGGIRQSDGQIYFPTELICLGVAS